jgi:hypothetical protein
MLCGKERTFLQSLESACAIRTSAKPRGIHECVLSRRSLRRKWPGTNERCPHHCAP